MDKEEFERILISPEGADELEAMSDERWKALLNSYLGLVFYSNISAKMNQTGTATRTRTVEMSLDDLSRRINTLYSQADDLLNFAEDFENGQAGRDKALAKVEPLNKELKLLEEQRWGLAGNTYPVRDGI